MTRLHINEVLEKSYPTEVVVARFPGERTAEEIGRIITQGGIDEDQVWLFEGREGVEAFESRGSLLSKLFRPLDNLHAPIRDAVRDGEVVAAVRCVGEDHGQEVAQQLRDQGAAKASYVGTWTTT